MQRFVIHADGQVAILRQLVDGEYGVVWLNDCLRYKGRRHDGEGSEHPIGLFFTKFGEQEGAQPGARATTEGVNELESL
jgi:hypothetical protein